MSDERSGLYADAVLGRDANEFLASDLGRYMLGRAKIEEDEAIEALAQVWPWRRRKIQQLQNQLWRARSLRGWLAELVNSGHQAEDQLEALSEEQ